MSKQKENIDIEINQYMMGINKSNFLKEIIGNKEACEILNIDNSYLNKLVKKGEFEAWEYKNMGRFKVFLKSSIVARRGKFKEYKKNNK